jgi:formate dehydrogenase alpha subunit
MASEEAGGLQLVSGTSMKHFGTTSTWAPAPREVEPEGLIRLSASDAHRAGVASGDKVKLTSTTGSTVGKVEILDSLPPGIVFAPNNFIDLGISRVLPDGSNRTPIEISKV